jgi:ketosteroid isomerase-like protein
MAEAPPPHAKHPHVARYERMIEGFNANDLEAVREVLDADVRYVIPGRSPIAGEFVGVEEHVAMLRRARDRSGGTLRIDPKAVLANDEYLFVYGRITAEREGKELDADHCVVFRFRGDKIIEGRTIPVDQYEFDRFWE